MLGGVLLPLLASFTDITLRTVLKEYLEQTPLTIVSFGLLFALYTLGYRFLWPWIFNRYDLDRNRLLAVGTLLILLSHITIYASLFQKGNSFSNLVWLGFYIALLLIFYVLGKQHINQSQTK